MGAFKNEYSQEYSFEMDYYCDIGYDPHDTILLFYDGVNNWFTDGSFGNIVYDIHRLLTPWQIRLFKQQGDCVFPDRTNSFLIELIEIPF